MATSSLVIGRAMALVQNLPEWLEQGTESSLRDTEDDVRPPGLAQVVTPRSIASTSHGPTPIVLTPTGSSPAPWTDLDKFYADVDEVAESDDDGNDRSDNSDDDGEESGISEGDVEDVSGDEGTASESEDDSITDEGILGNNSRELV